MQIDFEQIKQVLTDYSLFCAVAKDLEWLDIPTQYKYWCPCYPLGIDWCSFCFPKQYLKENVKQAFVQAYLSRVAFYEEWEQDFWNISKSDRKHCLEKGKALYAPPKELRLLVQEHTEFCKQIKYFLNYNAISKAEQDHFFALLKGADVFEIGGYYSGDFEYLAVNGDMLFLIACGFWD